MRPTHKNFQLLSFWVLGIVSFSIRAFINFSQELLAGNGGYYPLQVRTVLERGELAFPDMPFLFYLDAGIVRLCTFIGIPASNELILAVVKTVDSLSVPLLLIPLYQLLKLSKRTNFSLHTLIVAAFAVLSFYTLHLLSSFQKNSFAITILFFSLAWFMKYLKTKKTKHLIATIAFFILIGLTHFGTFSFALLFGILFLVFEFKKKAILPIVSLIASALVLIYLFDPVRSERLLLVWKSFFSKSPHLPQLIMSFIYLIIAVVAIRAYRKYKDQFCKTDKAIILTLSSLLIIISLPIIDGQIFDRMSTFLFVPVVLLLFIFNPFITLRSKKAISILLGLVTLGSVSFFLIMTPPAEVTKKALDDMAKMKPLITNPDHSVIVSRHNLEFWTAWALEVDVSQESKFNDTLINDYDAIFILNQIRDKNSPFNHNPNDKKPGRSHFEEPLIPVNSTLVYSSEYFKLYRYNKLK